MKGIAEPLVPHRTVTKPSRPKEPEPGQVLWSGTVAPIRPAPLPKVPADYDPLPIFQLKGERERLVVTGRRTDDDARCELLVIADLSGSFALYPHGVDRFGVRLERQAAVRVAQVILAAAESAPAESAPAEQNPGEDAGR